MNKVKRRAMSALLVAVLVLGGIGVYIVRYIEHGAEWATFAANSSVYTSGVLSTGTLTDRSGVVLATANGGSRSYADDAAVRTACYQAVGDYTGNIGTGALKAFSKQLSGYNPITGTYATDGHTVALTPAGQTLLTGAEDLLRQADALAAAVTEKTALLILNSPNNPSGVVVSRPELEALAALLREKQARYGHPIYIIADEPYRELVYGGVEVPFLPAIYPNAIYCYSYSKTLSLPGERVGFLALHPAMDDYAAVHAAVLGAGRALGYVCVSSLFQLAVAECLGQTADIAAYAANRELIYGALTLPQVAGAGRPGVLPPRDGL